MKVLALLAAIVLLPLLAAGGLAFRDDDLEETARSATPVLTSPTPRTVTDERQLRIVAAAIPDNIIVLLPVPLYDHVSIWRRIPRLHAHMGYT